MWQSFDQTPSLVIWEVTQACDLACRHCRASAEPGRHHAELSTEQGYALLEEIRSFGDPLVVFTGGDPLKRPDLLPLLARSVMLGLRTTVTPSATPLLTERAVCSIAACGVARMAISIDDAAAASHDAFRGEEGSFQRSLDALEFTRRAGLETQVNTTVTGRTIPRAVVFSILGVAVIDVAISFGFIGVIPWREAIGSEFIGATFVEAIHGAWAGKLLAGMVVVTAFGSIFALLLGYSRVPYAAAKDGVFFRWLGALHPTMEFPHRSLVLIGCGSIAASFLSLEAVIKALMAARILVQFIGHTVALILIRAHRKDIERPFKMWLYPLPALVSLIGYAYVFLSLGTYFVLFGIGTLALGVVVFLVAAKRQAEWPFARPGT